ncbi:MAG: 50S ribosomal protein L19 [Candidatus Pacebacteria bacterium]|nr:50S ribosomal protein L19 [Candidatus Paceibacterota bacterium]MBP9840059.1 50S ribosomal protein L19 [Candidatus Paceibacterota bacterium]
MNAVISPVKVAERAKLGIRPGDTVRVEQRITEVKKSKGADKKEKSTKTTRTQAFEGLVIAVKHGTEAGATFTVRATMSGIGVEKIYPLYSPAIESITIVRRSKVRRAKLYFIREKAAKAVRRQLRNMRMVSIATDESIVDEPEAPAEETAPVEAPVETTPEEVAAEEGGEKKEEVAA